MPPLHVNPQEINPSTIPLLSLTPSNPNLLGTGSIGTVLKQDENTAIKIPKRLACTSPAEINENIAALHHEQEVYKRLSECPGVVKVVSTTPATITFELMRNNSLENWLQLCKKRQRARPSREMQMRWFREIARGLANIHRRGVLVVDIAKRNLLLDEGLGVKFCDFDRARIFPLDGDTQGGEDVHGDVREREIHDPENEYSVRTDIARVGWVMFSVMSELEDMGTGRERDDTRGLWLGWIVDKCWGMEAYRDAGELVEELEGIDVSDRWESDSMDESASRMVR